METPEHVNIEKLIEDLSSGFNYATDETAILLAAGHGKRIKSHTSKMLHKIWEVPTVERVYNACRSASPEMNIIVVIGIKAADVAEVIGKKHNTKFAYQQTQNGTGHAVQVALEKIDPQQFNGIIYVLPGDMGLLDRDTVLKLRNEFRSSESDMMVLTGIFEGNPSENSYGRIIRVKEKDDSGQPSKQDRGNVVEIIEHKDILALPEDKPYTVTYNGKKYSYTRKELIENNEFNSGVYAFRSDKLLEQIGSLSSNNVQNEIYITDLIALFNKQHYSVRAISPSEQHVVMGFNNKSVLKEMENVAREKIYEQLKDIIEIKDPDDFFIDEKVVEEILEQDRKGNPLDIIVGKGVYIGKGVELNYNVQFKTGAYVNGNVKFGQNVVIWNNVHLSCFPGQSLVIGNNVEILWGDIIKGNIEIGDNCRIESSVNMTGSDKFPLRIGKNVLIKGTSYIFGSIIGDDVPIEHSVLIQKRIRRTATIRGVVHPVRFYIPPTEGTDFVDDL